MFAGVHSFSELHFLQSPPSDFEAGIDEVIKFIEYQFTAHNVAADRSLFNTLSHAVDNKLPLSLIHSMLEDDGFLLEDVLDIFSLRSVKHIRLLGVSHFYLSFRQHTLFWAMMINLELVLHRHSDRDNPNPWIDLADLLADFRLLTADTDMLTKALCSNVPNNVEARLLEDVIQV